MQVNEFETSAAGRSRTHPDLADLPGGPEAGTDLSEPFIDPLELEALALILEHSLKVHTNEQFFCWSQGLLQNLIRHEVLICALRKGDSASFHVDSFSSSVSDPALLSGLFSRDMMLVPLIIKAWEENRFQPVFLDLGKEDAAVNSNLGQELTRMGASEILVHGTYDTFGRPASFFIFGCQAGSIAARQHHLAALLVPSLHAAWVHTQFSGPASPGQAKGQAGNDLLTSREQEILGWIYRGKSNIEIGMILGISPLTVKNHVQKILRRLDVMNRTQAVGKALALRILDNSLAR